jgi:hypothetical protein
MAESLAHKFGQIIGDLLEKIVENPLSDFANRHKLYLDRKGPRSIRKGKLLTWSDGVKNIHSLDFVLERGGSDTVQGLPVAFIEIAWRRYTKHSKNKAQEIQAAVLPIALKNKNSHPFIGVILAGEFTKNALTQLESSGFCVLYFPYKIVLQAFNKYNIDISTSEKTSEKEFKKKISAWERYSYKDNVANELLQLNKKEIETFFECLEKSTSRFIERVVILPLHGKISDVSSIEDAISFLKTYSEANPLTPILKYEIIIKYNNGDKIEVSFKDKADTIKFLQDYL